MAFFRGQYLPVTSWLSLRGRVLRYYRANRSLLAWRRLVSFRVLRLLGRSVPTFIDIGVTYRCQCRCLHCSAEGQKRPGLEEMTSEEIKSVIDQARDMGIPEVIFSGGEPLLRQDTIELVGYAHEAGMITRLNTNGLLLDRDRVAGLKKAGLTLCGVSFDASDPLVHDQFCGVPGAFNRALDGLRLVREFGILSQMLVLASRSNILSGLGDLLKLGRRAGASFMFIFWPIASGRWKNARVQVLDREERSRVRRFQDLTFAYCELPTEKTLCCHADKSIFYVNAHGEVTPCPFAPFVIGSIRQGPLKDLWQRYTSRWELEFRDDCPLNDFRKRELFRSQVEAFRLRDKPGG